MTININNNTNNKNTQHEQNRLAVESAIYAHIKLYLHIISQSGITL